MRKIRYRIFQIIEPGKRYDTLSLLFDRIILILITLSVLSVILESFVSLKNKYYLWFNIFEILSISIFTVEYILRIYTADYKYPESSSFKSSFKYIVSPMAMIDLLAIVPFYLPLLIPVDLRFLRILRLTRILRILKVNRYTKSLKLINRVLKRKKEELIITIFVTFLLMLLSASIMYYVENDSQPDVFPNILASFWWAVATLTTVGYGDVYPITGFGKLLSGIIALLGIGIVALPTGIISSGFIEELESEKSKNINMSINSKMILYNYTHKNLLTKKQKYKLKKHC